IENVKISGRLTLLRPSFGPRRSIRMSSVLLRPEEQPIVAYDPRKLLYEITTGFEGLRSCLRERRDVPFAEIAEQALRCARALTQLAETAQLADQRVVATPPVVSPTVKIERVTTPATQSVAAAAVANCDLRRRCRETTYLLFPG